MGYFLGNRIPDYYPLWEEHKDEPDWWKWYHLGYDEGYGEGSEYKDKIETLEQENEALRGLLAANVRVKEEIRKEMVEDAPGSSILWKVSLDPGEAW